MFQKNRRNRRTRRKRKRGRALQSKLFRTLKFFFWLPLRLSQPRARCQFTNNDDRGSKAYEDNDDDATRWAEGMKQNLKMSEATSRFAEFTQHGVYCVERGINLFPDLKVARNE